MRYEERVPNAGIWAKRVSDGFKIARRVGLNPEWGTVIGRLHMEGKLTELEVQAAFVYASVAARYDHYHPNKERSPRTVQSQAYQISLGQIDEVERHHRNETIKDYERAARRAQKRWEKAQKAIDPSQAPPSLARLIRYRSQLRTVTDAACLFDELVPEAMIPLLKAALSRMAVVFGLQIYHQDTAVENRRRLKSLSVDKRVALALETITRWFSDDKVVPSGFRLVATEKERGVQLFGAGNNGDISKQVLIRCHSRDLVAHVDSLFLTGCQRRGWKER